MTSEAVIEAATASIERGSRSFAAAARLFDPRTRQSAVMLYAWCRHCDDLVDDQAFGFRDGGAPVAQHAGPALERLRALTRAAYRGESTEDPVFAGFAEVVRRHAIPERYPLEHLDGFAMDLAGRRYRSIEEVLDYCHHVAGVVGIMMAHVMGVRDAPVLARARDLGLAFQLTNIARDVVEDAAIGRCYLPQAWLEEAGVPPAELAAPRHRAAVAAVVARLLDEAERHYASATEGIAALPFRSAWAIATARGVYRAIGVEVRRRGPRAWDRRVSTSAPQKLGFVLRGAAEAARLTRFGTR